MAELETQIPLKWPKFLAVTPAAQRSFSNGFKSSMTLDEALGYVQDEIREMAPQKAILYTDIEQIAVARLRRKLGNSVGASLEIKLEGRGYFFACDRWQSLEHNLYALHLVVRNFRTMARWGVADIHQMMAGFCTDGHRAAHPAAGDSAEAWRDMLGLGVTATLEDAQAVYRRRVKLVADDQDALMRLNTAIDEARRHLR